MTETVEVRDSERIVNRLKLYFAILSCLGGLVLSAGDDSHSLSVIAVFFAVFGFLFVDWLQLFALPPIAAYALMALAALYCVSDFADLDSPGNHQMIAVARLLVFVQAILMLQRKSRRIFEQLGVFCLLELIVAAVFNNAINYGLLLIPLGVIGAGALCLLAAVSASEGLEPLNGLDGSDDTIGFLRRPESSPSISISSPDSAKSMAAEALRLPRIALLTLAPSVLLVGVIFFYALPRTTDAARVRNRGNALVGFNDDLQLEQIGQMMKSPQTAMRLYLTDRKTGQPYNVVGGIYLRGRVLERYNARMSGDKNTAAWSSLPVGLISGAQMLPDEYFPTRSTDQNFYDSVDVAVTCESMRSNSLFAIAPYHRRKINPDIVHMVGRWTISRRNDKDWDYPRINYTFGTNAFRRGIQSELVTRWSQGEEMMSPPEDGAQLESGVTRRQRVKEGQRADSYMDEVTEFDLESMPTAAALAEKFVTSATGERRTTYRIAREMERYLATSGEYEYTLDLSAESRPGVDPIEQFLAFDKKGHCQFYASALAMMLRSQDIPARVVVGYNTDEYNELGQHYVARQLHAHAWVEALVDRDEFDESRIVYGQPPSQKYWLRLDPTPTGRRIRESSGGVGQVFDMAQNIWDDYVVDMDAGRQGSTLLGGGINPMTGPYDSLVDSLSLMISRIRAGELGGGAWAGRELFSWPAAVLGVFMTLAIAVLLRVKTPNWIRRRLHRTAGGKPARPSIAFYAETLDQLARLGITRQASQTPAELADHATQKLEHPLIPSIAKPMRILTSTFYRLRFGSSGKDERDLEMRGLIEHARQQNPEVSEALAELTRSVDLMMVNSNGAERTN
jgi:transglutaminase-like putative cysteine protease